MSAFKPGDKVLIRARMGHPTATDGVYFVTIDCGRIGVSVPASALLPASEPPYVDPELVPGMVVMSEDRSDDRHWHYLPEDEADTRSFYGRDEDGDYVWYIRDELPGEIRPVFDPREATS